jgi:antitoxin component of MazEF toxin-antitoxin module
MAFAIVFKRTVRRSGNSYVIAIPPEIVESLNLMGSRMSFEPNEDGIFLRRQK